MKFSLKNSRNFFTLFTTLFILSSVFLPVAVSAQENIHKSDLEIHSDVTTKEIENKNSEIQNSDLEVDNYNTDEEASKTVRFLFEEKLGDQDITEKDDLALLNSALIKIIEEDLFLSFPDTVTNYTLSIETQDSDYEKVTSELEKEQLRFYNLNRQSKITIRISNNETHTENVISITTNSDDLEDINNDITVNLHQITDKNLTIEDSHETETIVEKEDNSKPQVASNIEEKKEVSPSEQEEETENDLEISPQSEHTLMSLSDFDTVLSNKEVDYNAVVLPNNEGIYTKPYGTKDAILYTSYKFNNQEVKVVEEATTKSGTFAKLVTIKEESVLGWIKTSDIKTRNYDNFLTRKDVEYYGIVLSKNSGIYTLPYGMRDAVLYTSYKYNNKKVKIVEEATTQSGTYLKLASLEDNGTLGWIKKSDVNIYDGFLTTKKVEYYATVKANNEGIYTKPKGLPGAVLYTSYKYNNKKVKATEETTTARGTFVKLVSLEDNGTLGWIKKSDVNIYDGFLTTKKVEYYATVKANNEGIYTKPKGLPGAVLYTSYKYNNKKVKATEETTTARGTFVKLVSLEDNGTLGWIKKSDVNIYDGFLTTKKVEYYATVNANNEGIYTKPKGLPGAVLYTSYKYNNKKVKVTEEATTAQGLFAKIARIEDGTIIGWIKKNNLNSEKIVFLDAGHGGTESGASYYGVKEEVINLEVTKKVKANLEALGYIVIMSRETDETVSLLERSMAANSSNADIFVSIHHNAMPGNTYVSGIETYYYQYDPDYPSKINQKYHNDPTRVLESARLATDIHKSLISSTGAKDRGIRRNTFAVLRETAVPAVLLELGYMSSPLEIVKLNSNSYQNTLARAITNGIVNYFD